MFPLSGVVKLHQSKMKKLKNVNFQTDVHFSRDEMYDEKCVLIRHSFVLNFFRTLTPVYGTLNDLSCSLYQHVT